MYSTYNYLPWDSKMWILLKDVHCLEVNPQNYLSFWKAAYQAGHCRQLVVDQRSITHVWLYKKHKYTYIFFFFRKRPTLEEMQGHRWLNPADYMLKKRERAHFTTNRIQVNSLINFYLDITVMLFIKKNIQT